MFAGAGIAVVIAILLAIVVLLWRWSDGRMRLAAFGSVKRVSDGRLAAWLLHHQSSSRRKYIWYWFLVSLLAALGAFYIASLVLGATVYPGLGLLWLIWRYVGHLWDAYIAEAQARTILPTPPREHVEVTVHPSETTPSAAPSPPQPMLQAAPPVSQPPNPSVPTTYNYGAAAALFLFLILLLGIFWVASRQGDHSSAPDVISTGPTYLSPTPSAPSDDATVARAWKIGEAQARKQYPSLNDPQSSLFLATVAVRAEWDASKDQRLGSPNAPLYLVEEAANRVAIARFKENGTPQSETLNVLMGMTSTATSASPVSAPKNQSKKSTHHPTKQSATPMNATPSEVVASVYSNTAEQSRKRAVLKYPDLGHSGTDLNLRYMNRYNVWSGNDDPRLTRPDWPELLADDCVAHP